MNDPNLLTRMLYGLSRKEQVDEIGDESGARQFVQQFEITGMNALGEVVTQVVRRETLLDCGCSPSLSRPAGRCGFCGGYVCQCHFYSCAGCGMPLGECHVNRHDDGQTYCESCLVKLKSRERWQKARHFLFGRRKEEKNEFP